MKNRIIFATLVLIVWFITISLPIWGLEITDSTGFSLFDGMSTLVNDNHHLPFMFFSGPILALMAIINPNKLLMMSFIFYIFILICGLLGFAFSQYVELKWGWYVHLIAMFIVMFGGGRLLPEAFNGENR
jgi:hypothetical protein